MWTLKHLETNKLSIPVINSFLYTKLFYRNYWHPPPELIWSFGKTGIQQQIPDGDFWSQLDIYKVPVLETECQKRQKCTFSSSLFLVDKMVIIYCLMNFSSFFFFWNSKYVHSNINHTQICFASVKLVHHIIWGKKLGLYFSILFTCICVGLPNFVLSLIRMSFAYVCRSEEYL